MYHVQYMYSKCMYMCTLYMCIQYMYVLVYSKNLQVSVNIHCIFLLLFILFYLFIFASLSCSCSNQIGTEKETAMILMRKYLTLMTSDTVSYQLKYSRLVCTCACMYSMYCTCTRTCRYEMFVKFHKLYI